MKRLLAAMDRRPWALAALASAGATLLLCGALPLAASAETLDALIELGDTRLGLCVAGAFALGVPAFRLLLWRRRLPEEELDDEPPARAPQASARREPEPSRGYLR
jgi:hypothetical protein